MGPLVLPKPAHLECWGEHRIEITIANTGDHEDVREQSSSSILNKILSR